MQKVSLNTIKSKIEKLKASSNFQFELDLNIYESYPHKEAEFFPLGHPELINNDSDCSQCFYAFQIDSYAEGCTHNCVYCWAKFALEKENRWNNPRPIPIDIASFWEMFHQIFDLGLPHKFSEVILKKVPIRIGSYSDPFLSYEAKFGITFEMIRILNHYNYPYLFVTRSDLLMSEKYLQVINKDLCAIQISIPTLNEDIIRALEPSAPSPKLRLDLLKKLSDLGFHVVVRINPLFPSHEDGFYSDIENRKMEYRESGLFSLSMIKTLSEYGCKSLLVGFVHLPEKTMNEISKNISFKHLMKEENQKSEKFKYSEKEITAYYQKIKQVCIQYEIKFSTCYLGLGEAYYWKDQKLWDNKSDCCDLKGQVSAFKTTAQDVGYLTRLHLKDEKQNFIKNYLEAIFLKLKEIILKSIFG